MTGTGWAILILLLLLALDESTIIILGIILAIWAVSVFKRTGNLPRISEEIEKLFIDKKDKR